MTLYDFLSGAVAFGFFVCGLFFLRYWSRSRDQLFLAFALVAISMGLIVIIYAARASTRTVGFCKKCGYDLRLLRDARRCPECGTYYLYESAYEFLIGFGGSYDEQRLCCMIQNLFSKID